MARPRAHSPAAQQRIAELVEANRPDLIAAVEACAAELGVRVDKATALRYHAERYPVGQAAPPAGAAAAAAPVGNPDDASEISRLVALRDQAIRAAQDVLGQNPRLALAWQREALRSSLEIDKLRERTRGRTEGEKRRQVVLYLPERRAP